MTDANRQMYREKLLRLADEAKKETAILKNEAGEVGEVSGQFTEQHQEQADLGVTLTLLNNEKALSAEINSAIQRIDDGTFGTCLKCQKAISQERLNTIPYTRYCIHCA